MADVRIISRLADLHEFDELRKEFLEREEEAVRVLARKTYMLPEDHDTLEWQKLKAFYAGVHAVLALPMKTRESERKEQQ